MADSLTTSGAVSSSATRGGPIRGERRKVQIFPCPVVSQAVLPGVETTVASLHPRTRVTQPEHRLMLAVLEDALTILAHDPSRPEDRLFTETRDWIGSDDISWPFSFLNVCENLDVDVARLRTRLSRLPGISAGSRRPDARPARGTVVALRRRRSR